MSFDELCYASPDVSHLRLSSVQTCCRCCSFCSRVVSLEQSVAADVDNIMQEIRTLGRLPRNVPGDSGEQQSEHNLARRLECAMKKQLMSQEQSTELQQLESAADVKILMNEARSLERSPRRVPGDSAA